MIPASWATTAAAARLSTPSLARRELTWALTVPSTTCRRRAIWPLDRPPPRRASTSRSRGEGGDPVTGGGAPTGQGAGARGGEVRDDPGRDLR